MQDELAILSREYDIVQVVLNSSGYNVPQSRNRFIIIAVHRSLGVEASYPAPSSSLEGLRICDVLPYLDGIQYGYAGKKFKHKTGICNTITKTPNIWATENKQKRNFKINELLKLCAYPNDWQYTGSYNQLWNRIGNSIMPPFMQAIGEHIYINILQKAGVPLQNIEPFLYKPNVVVAKTKPAKKPVRIKKRAK